MRRNFSPNAKRLAGGCVEFRGGVRLTELGGAGGAAEDGFPMWLDGDPHRAQKRWSDFVRLRGM